ncbi:hypothetical protein DITRI_Ditri14bG0143000 [Diplodiscus trichospermus]
MLKLGIQPTVVTLSTLINGLYAQEKIAHAVNLFDDMIGKGYHPNLITYSTILNGLCKMGNTKKAVKLLRSTMEERGFKLDIVEYDMVIDSLCKDRLLSEALELFAEVKHTTQYCHLQLFNPCYVYIGPVGGGNKIFK